MKRSYMYVGDGDQQAIMDQQKQFPAMAAAAVEHAKTGLVVARGNKGGQPRKPREDGACHDCGHAGRPMFRRTQCKACRLLATMHRQNTTTRGIAGKLVTHAKKRHRQKNGGSADGFDVTIDAILQKIVDNRGYCGISGVVHVSFKKQSPFFVSIESLPGTADGYFKDGWTVAAGIFNHPSRPMMADFKTLATLGNAFKPPYPTEDVTRPAKIDDVYPKKPDDGHEWVICSICWLLGDKESMSGSHHCPDCRSWYNHTMDTKLSMMAINCKQADAKSKRPAPKGLSKESLKELFDAQGGKCAVSGLPFARGVKLGERYSCFAISCDRLDNTRPHDIDNVRLVCALFNPPDGNRRREGFGVNKPPAGQCEPYSFMWTKKDYQILAQLCGALN